MERKRKGGAEKLRNKKKLALQADAAKCAKITDMFAKAGPSSAPVADDSGAGGSGTQQEHVVEPAKVNEKVHDGVCQHCKDVLEWKVKYNKYKPLTQPRKCVKCSQKTIKDAYHIMCKPCALKLDLCAKCGKKEEIVIPLATPQEMTTTTDQGSEQGHKKTKKAEDDEDFDEFDSDCDLSEDDLN